MAHLTYTVDQGGVAVISLQNPPQNRIDDQMVDELDAALAGIERSGARVVIVQADGPDFSWGGDITTWPLDDIDRMRSIFGRYMAVFNRFERLPIPTIACVQGLCFGGGFELALRADVLFAAAGARFGHPEQSIGIITLLGGIQRVAERAGPAFAAEWALTSEQVPAEVMARHGIVNRVVPDECYMQEAHAFAARLSTGPTRAYAVHKALIAAWADGGVAAADRVLLGLSMQLFEGSDARAGISSAITALAEGRQRPRLEFSGR